MKGIGERNNMEEWKEYKLYEIADVQTGPFGSQLHNEDYVPEGTPIVTVEHLGSRKFTYQNLPKVSEKDRLRLSKYTMSIGDIIFSRVGSVDRCSYVDLESNGWMFSGRCLRIHVLNQDEVNTLFLYYYFCIKEIKQHLRNIAVGATMPSLNTKLLNNINICIPSKECQDAIAKILGSIDDKIELNNRINANLEEQAQTLFRRWFVDFEFPNEQGLPYKSNGGRFVESELGRIPNGWKVFHADEVFHINIGKTPPRKEQEWFSNESKNNIKWVSISDLGGIGVFVNDSKEYLSKDAISKFNIIVVPRNTVLLSFKLTVGRVAIANCKLTTNEAIARFYLPKEYFREYTYLALKNYNYSKLGSTSSIAIAVNSKIIKAMPILIPSDNILKLFNVVMAPVFNIIEKNQTTIENLVSLRDTLLPKLMNNEINL